MFRFSIRTQIGQHLPDNLKPQFHKYYQFEAREFTVECATKKQAEQEAMDWMKSYMQNIINECNEVLAKIEKKKAEEEKNSLPF